MDVAQIKREVKRDEEPGRGNEDHLAGRLRRFELWVDWLCEDPTALRLCEGGWGE